MAYSSFSFDQVKEKLALTIEDKRGLFSHVTGVQLHDHFLTTLADNASLAVAINTEKAKSELIISPILVELRNLVAKKISLFSGIEFNVEEENGLRGTCDFIISLSAEQFFIVAPVVTIVEAKKDNITEGLPQCIAEMKAAQLFNDRKQHSIATLYGVVTTGSIWKFLQLTNHTVYIDLDEYHVKEIDTIMGILLGMVND